MNNEMPQLKAEEPVMEWYNIIRVRIHYTTKRKTFEGPLGRIYETWPIVPCTGRHRKWNGGWTVWSLQAIYGPWNFHYIRSHPTVIQKKRWTAKERTFSIDFCQLSNISASLPLHDGRQNEHMKCTVAVEMLQVRFKPAMLQLNDTKVHELQN